MSLNIPALALTRRLAAAAIAALATLCCAAPALAADPDEVKLAWGPGASWDFAYAQHVDLWRRFNLKINMIEGANGAALLPMLGSGEVQTATMAPSAMIVANSIGINLRVIYADASTTKLGLYANPASGMTADPKTWKGKNIGIAKNSQADYALRWSLQKAGMKVSDVNVVVLAPPVAVPAYQRGQIDGYYVWDVWGARLEASGAKLVQRAVDVGFASSSHAAGAAFQRLAAVVRQQDGSAGSGGTASPHRGGGRGDQAVPGQPAGAVGAALAAGGGPEGAGAALRVGGRGGAGRIDHRPFTQSRGLCASATTAECSDPGTWPCSG